MPLHAVIQADSDESEDEDRGSPVISLVPRGGLAGEPGASIVAGLLPALMKALGEGLAHPVGGEVVVRAGEVIGRIYLYKGTVAWVNCSCVETRVRDTLLAHAGIDTEELDAALQDCRQQRRHFAETLLEWGLIDRERLWQCLLRYTAQHLSVIFQLRDDPQVLFVPLVRTYSAGMVFTLEQLLDACEAQKTEAMAARQLPLTEPPPAPPVPEAAPLAAPRSVLSQPQGLYPGVSERLAALLPSGVLAAALVDRETRQLRARVIHMQELTQGLEDLSSWLLTLLEGRSTEPASPPREVLLVAEDSVHTVTRGTVYPTLFLWVMFDASTSVGRCLAHGHLAMKTLEQDVLAAFEKPAAEPA